MLPYSVCSKPPTADGTLQPPLGVQCCTCSPHAATTAAAADLRSSELAATPEVLLELKPLRIKSAMLTRQDAPLLLTYHLVDRQKAIRERPPAPTANQPTRTHPREPAQRSHNQSQTQTHTSKKPKHEQVYLRNTRVDTRRRRMNGGSQTRRQCAEQLATAAAATTPRTN